MIIKMWESELSVNTHDSDYVTIICEDRCQLLVALAYGSYMGDIVCIYMSALNVLEKGRNKVCLCRVRQLTDGYPQMSEYSIPHLLMVMTDDEKVLIDTKELVCESSDSETLSRLIRVYCPQEVPSLRYLSSCSIRSDQVSTMRDSFSEDYVHANFLSIRKVKLRFHSGPVNMPDVTCHCE